MTEDEAKELGDEEEIVEVDPTEEEMAITVIAMDDDKPSSTSSSA